MGGEKQNEEIIKSHEENLGIQLTFLASSLSPPSLPPLSTFCFSNTPPWDFWVSSIPMDPRPSPVPRLCLQTRYHPKAWVLYLTSSGVSSHMPVTLYIQKGILLFRGSQCSLFYHIGPTSSIQGASQVARGKESTCQSRRQGFNP